MLRFTWTELSNRVQTAIRERGINIHEAGRRGVREANDGPPSSQAQLRLFGAKEQNVRVILYRDNHAWCPYCHKVWMQLEEKRIPYRVEKVSMNCYGTKRRDFLAKTPRGLLPAIEIDGQFMTESSVIMQQIEEAFPEKSLLRPGTNQMLNLERNLFGAWLQWLRADDSARAKKAFEQSMDATELALTSSGGPYFMGADLTLVDCVFASTLERIAASILYYKGLNIRGKRWPKVEAWFREMEKRDSYKASRSDYHTHVHDLPPQIGGCLASGTREQKTIAAAIDGMDSRSWNLPLPPLTVDSAEPGVEDPMADKLEAANALIHCHEKVVSSSQGDASSDLAFRYVCLALIQGVDALQSSPDALAHGGIPSSAANSLRHTRDRISVPRDMSFAAARQLRAHLNWVADIIDPVTGWRGTPIPTQDRRDTDPRVFGASL